MPVQSDAGGGAGSGGGGVVGGRGTNTSGLIPAVLSSGSSASSADDNDHTLTGNWEQLWENRLQRCKFNYSINYLTKEEVVSLHMNSKGSPPGFPLPGKPYNE